MVDEYSNRADDSRMSLSSVRKQKVISNEEFKRVKDGLRMIMCNVFECLEIWFDSVDLFNRWKDSSETREK